MAARSTPSQPTRLTALWIATLLLAATACTPPRAEGIQCMFSGECMTPLICAGRFCRAQCTSDRDCPNTFTCSDSDTPAQRVCLPPGADVLCSSSAQCGTGRVCVGQTCRRVCMSDTDCAGAGRCLMGACERPETVQARGGDGGADVPDVAVDALADVPVDAPVDGPVDAPFDVPVDDVGTDADATPDGTPDISTDVVDADDAPDAMAEAGSDAGSDATTDASDATDVIPDSPCGADLANDPNNCGRCGMICVNVPNSMRSCMAGVCRAVCTMGFGDCDAMYATGCESRLDVDPRNCGACGRACATGQVCISGMCNSWRFASDGSDGPFNPARGSTTALPGGVRNYTTINIQPGTTVVSMDGAPLELRATGDVTIAGSVRVDGGNGSMGFLSSGGCSTAGAYNGTGGMSGRPANGRTFSATLCAIVALGGDGMPGADGAGPMACGYGGRNGGGAGGRSGSGLAGGGGGGGGWAGGGGGGGVMGGAAVAGGDGAIAAMSERGLGGTGMLSMLGGGGGASLLSTAYAGGAGRVPMTLCSGGSGGGGGGGSIGGAAAMDLAVATVFRGGSAGGGGGSPAGCRGGGAVRITSSTSIRILAGATVNADGGDGGTGGTLGSNGSGGGGGGSGGVVYLAAPYLSVAGVVTARGGTGETGGACGGRGGNGGMGRIRVSTHAMPCDLTGTWNPPLPAPVPCARTGAMPPEAVVYVGDFPPP